MTIKPPCIITSRHLPGVKIDNCTISIEESDRPSRDGRVRYRYYIDIDGGVEYSADDLKSEAMGAPLQEMLASLLIFMEACGESMRCGRRGENSDLFPPEVAEWCGEHTDEIGMARLELRETEGAIEE